MKFLIPIILLFSCQSFGQIKKTNQQWVHYYSQLNISKKWSVLTDAGFRWQNKFQNKSLYLVRSAIAYETNPSLRLAVGFAHLGFFSSDSLYKLEFRPYQEITFKKSFNSFKSEQRFRVEERIFDGFRSANNSPYNSFKFRFRYQIALNFPVRKLTFKSPNRSISLTVSNEIFLNAGNKNLSFFDQHRVVLGPTFQINEKLIVSMLYNMQFASSSQTKVYLLSSVAWLTIRHKIN